MHICECSPCSTQALCQLTRHTDPVWPLWALHQVWGFHRLPVNHCCSSASRWRDWTQLERQRANDVASLPVNRAFSECPLCHLCASVIFRSPRMLSGEMERAGHQKGRRKESPDWRQSRVSRSQWSLKEGGRREERRRFYRAKCILIPSLQNASVYLVSWRGKWQ